MKHVVRAIVVLLLPVTVMAGTTSKVEAMSAKEVKSFVIETPDTLFKLVIDAGVWTVDRVMEACKKFEVCNWTKNQIQVVVTWLNETCDTFAICTGSIDQIQRVSSLLRELCTEVVICGAAVTWMGNHPGWALAIQLGVAAIIPVVGSQITLRLEGGPLTQSLNNTVVREVIKVYKTSTGVDFEVPAFSRIKGTCYTKCGKWVPKEARDPKRFLNKAEKKLVLDTVCNEKTCLVDGKMFPRSEAAIDHVVPHSCGGATSLANSVILHKDDNMTKAGCRI